MDWRGQLVQLLQSLQHFEASVMSFQPCIFSDSLAHSCILRLLLSNNDDCSVYLQATGSLSSE